MGIRGVLLQWFKAFLLNRQQRVVIDGQFSNWSNVSSGYLRGPMLFLIYVNDIGDDLSSTCKLFADDCVVFRPVNSRSDAEQLQCDLNHVIAWSRKWQLSFNLSKCKAICISSKRSLPSFPYQLNNVALEWVDSFKYLGVFVDNKLIMLNTLQQRPLQCLTYSEET